MNYCFQQCDSVKKDADHINFENRKDLTAYINTICGKVETNPGAIAPYEKQDADEVKRYNRELRIVELGYQNYYS